MPPLKNVDDVCLMYLVEREALMVRRAMNIHFKVNDLEGQRDNIFHTRYHVHNKVCNLIIDYGSCINVNSTELVSKLNLHTTKHLIPYKLQWLNNSGEVKVNKHVLVASFIGKYCDEVLCDVVPKQVSYLLLSRPWQYDRRVMHNELKTYNSYIFNT